MFAGIQQVCAAPVNLGVRVLWSVPVINIDSISFNLADCSLCEESGRRRSWMNPEHVAHLLQFDSGPPEWPFDLTNPQAAAEFYRNQCADMDRRGPRALRGPYNRRQGSPGDLRRK